MTLRQEKVKSLIKELASKFVLEQSSLRSLITVTDCSVSDDFRKSTIFFTAFPAENENEALDFLKRKRTEFRDYIKKEMEFMRVVPFFDFKIDFGEKNRQKIDEISNEI